MNYTKGKWKVYESPFAPAIILERPNRVIAVCRLERGSEGMTEATVNAYLIAAAVNGCIAVNSNNPQAVAESINDMYEELKKADTEICRLCKLSMIASEDCISCEEGESRLQALAKGKEVASETV